MAEEPKPDPPEPQVQVNIQIDHAQRAGVWANFALVSHSEHEFTLDFVRLEFANRQPDGTVPGVVVSRVSVSPLFVTQLLDALHQNWDRYAQKALPKEARDDPGDQGR